MTAEPLSRYLVAGGVALCFLLGPSPRSWAQGTRLQGLGKETPTEKAYAVADTGWRIAAPPGFKAMPAGAAFDLEWKREDRGYTGRMGQDGFKEYSVWKTEGIVVSHRYGSLKEIPEGGLDRHCGSGTEGSHHGKPTFSYSCEEPPSSNFFERKDYYRVEYEPGKLIILRFQGSVNVGSKEYKATVRRLFALPEHQRYPGLAVFRQFEGTLAPIENEVKPPAAKEPGAVPLLR